MFNYAESEKKLVRYTKLEARAKEACWRLSLVWCAPKPQNTYRKFQAWCRKQGLPV